jgi:hypothetical protein
MSHRKIETLKEDRLMSVNGKMALVKPGPHSTLLNSGKIGPIFQID